MVIRSKAPLRISFGGGGTDVAPFCEEGRQAPLLVQQLISMPIVPLFHEMTIRLSFIPWTLI